MSGFEMVRERNSDYSESALLEAWADSLFRVVEEGIALPDGMTVEGIAAPDGATALVTLAFTNRWDCESDDRWVQVTDALATLPPMPTYEGWGDSSEVGVYCEWTVTVDLAEADGDLAEAKKLIFAGIAPQAAMIADVLAAADGPEYENGAEVEFDGFESDLTW